MTPDIDLTAPPEPGLALVSDVAGVARVLCNLSGIGLMDRLTRERTASRRIELTLARGETITVQVDGSGRPVLLIHGLGGSHHDWDGAIEDLGRHHHIHRFDLMGHGARASSKRLPTLQQMAHDVAEVIAGLGLERPLLVGHSLGALVVMKYLQDHGAGQIAGVCLIDQSPRITNNDQWQLGLFGSLTQSQLKDALGRRVTQAEPARSLVQLEGGARCVKVEFGTHPSSEASASFHAAVACSRFRIDVRIEFKLSVLASRSFES
jgi:pimeloyl-ACP methyl ester carboxylesterase